MTEETKLGSSEVAAKPAINRPKKTLEQEIEAVAAKLRKLQEQQRENQKRERERNERAVRDFMKAEKLEEFDVEVWREAAAEIRTALERVASKISNPPQKEARAPKGQSSAA